MKRANHVLAYARHARWLAIQRTGHHCCRQSRTSISCPGYAVGGSRSGAGSRQIVRKSWRSGRGAGAALTGTPGPQYRIRELETTTQATERQLPEAHDYRTPIAARFTGPEVAITVRESARIAAEIIRVAVDQHDDLSAMVTHGRSGITHLLVGSVAQAMFRSGVPPVPRTKV